MKVSSFRELMAGHKSAEIRCLYTGTLVRKLSIDADGAHVVIDAMIMIVSVPLDTPITHQPWAMDRGNMLFKSSAVCEQTTLAAVMPKVPAELKICGEDDPITFDDGTTDKVQPYKPVGKYSYPVSAVERHTTDFYDRRPLPDGVPDPTGRALQILVNSIGGGKVWINVDPGDLIPM